MRHSTRFANAIHLLTYAYLRSDWQMSSKLIANSVNTTPVTIRQLNKAGIIETRPGEWKNKILSSTGRDKLARYFQCGYQQLIERNDKTNIKCQVGKQIPAILDNEFDKIEQVAKNKMKQIFLADIIEQVKGIKEQEKHHENQSN